MNCYNARLSFPLEEIIKVDVKGTEHPDIYTRKEPSLRKKAQKEPLQTRTYMLPKPSTILVNIHVSLPIQKNYHAAQPTHNLPTTSKSPQYQSLTPLHRFGGINIPIHLYRLHPRNPPKLLFRVLPKRIHQPFLPVPVQEFPHQVSRTLALQIDRVDAASCFPVGSACDGDFTAQGDPGSYVPVRSCGIPAQRPESVSADVCKMLDAQDTRKM